MKRKIAFACDHRGFEIKTQTLQILKDLGCEVIDCGTNSSESCDYNDFIVPAAEKVAQGICERAIGVCYTGIGSTIAANKVVGVRAALVHTVEEAKLSRAHNDSNMLILGSAFMDLNLLAEMIRTWLNTDFEGGRHERRVNKIREYEKKHCR